MDAPTILMRICLGLLVVGLAGATWGHIEANRATERAEAPCPEDGVDCGNQWHYFGVQAAWAFAMIGWSLAALSAVAAGFAWSWRRRHIPGAEA